MASFDVISLFTNIPYIPLEQTLEICLDKLFTNCNKVHNLTRRQLKKLLIHAVKQNHFMFEGKMFDQIDGVAMGSSLCSRVLFALIHLALYLQYSQSLL